MSTFNVFRDRTVLVTGHTGFKGSWLCTWLIQLGARVVGVSNDIPTSPSNFLASGLDLLVEHHCVDVTDFEKLKNVVEVSQPDFIFHLAAQALVRPSYQSPLDTFLINGIGSANVLEAVRSSKKLVSVVMVTSDKAYDNVEWVWGYRETDRIGGKDPYSASKGMAELAIRSYVASYMAEDEQNLRVGIARAGNVIGGGDWATDRIVPDCVKAWSQRKIVDIRNPNATRPWQHVLEPLSGYLSLGAELYQSNKLHGEAYNFGPPANQDFSVKHLIVQMQQYWENIAWSDESKIKDQVHEAGLLKLNCDKALAELHWRPTLGFEETVRLTAVWYKRFYENKDDTMIDFTIGQIKEFERLAKEKSISWAVDAV